jgi:hypothetical protein
MLRTNNKHQLLGIRFVFGILSRNSIIHCCGEMAARTSCAISFFYTDHLTQLLSFLSAACSKYTKKFFEVPIASIENFSVVHSEQSFLKLCTCTLWELMYIGLYLYMFSSYNVSHNVPIILSKRRRNEHGLWRLLPIPNNYLLRITVIGYNLDHIVLWWLIDSFSFHFLTKSFAVTQSSNIFIDCFFDFFFFFFGKRNLKC